ncbi:hypothetical protein [Fluviibacterium sp. S390]|uniref:hypothetical protein n=1 Tax=Fluviibacterium sp. S390 TaxID=3415139 RepID=UPI003C7A0BE7
MRKVHIRRVVLFVLAMTFGFTAAVMVQSQGVTGQKPSDVFFTEDGLESQITGVRLRFQDGGEARFFADHRYAYLPGDGRDERRGTWEVYDRGQVCVRFDSGAARCDTLVRSADRMVLIAASGDRFPVRSLLSLR